MVKGLSPPGNSATSTEVVGSAHLDMNIHATVTGLERDNQSPRGNRGAATTACLSAEGTARGTTPTSSLALIKTSAASSLQVPRLPLKGR